jgi:GNAT superfamily N-acetyltransferase
VAPSDLPTEVEVRLSDILAALLLSDEAKWNQVEADWTLFIEKGQVFGFRAGDRLIATAAVLPFGPDFAWISMVLVTADWRRKGLGSRLLNRCIETLRAQGRASLLDATPEGALVYHQLGFTSKCGMARWRGEGRGTAATPESAPSSLEEIAARDRHVFGGSRRYLIQDFADRPGTRIFRLRDSFLVARKGRRATQIGPMVSNDATEARALLEQALEAIEGRIIIDVLEAGNHLNEVLTARGFDAFRTFERMVLDRESLPGVPAELLLAAGPEFG